LKIVGTTLHAQATDEGAAPTLSTERRNLPSDGVVFCESLPPVRLDALLGD
jgi:hypothetical protein